MIIIYINYSVIKYFLILFELYLFLHLLILPIKKNYY